MIVGLAGLKGSGKDTAGAYLVERYGFVRKSFAQPLKDSAAALFNVPVEVWESAKNDPTALVILDYGQWSTRMTVREMLQRYGTEAHRGIPEFGESVWTDLLVNMLTTAIDGTDFVITDMRFENETRAVKERMGGYTLLIDRPGVADGDGHASEVLPDASLIDIVVPNDGSIHDLYGQLDWAISELRERDRIAKDARIYDDSSGGNPSAAQVDALLGPS